MNPAHRKALRRGPWVYKHVYLLVRAVACVLVHIDSRYQSVIWYICECGHICTLGAATLRVLCLLRAPPLLFFLKLESTKRHYFSRQK